MHDGRVCEEMLRKHLFPPGTDSLALMCGPPGMQVISLPPSFYLTHRHFLSCLDTTSLTALQVCIQNVCRSCACVVGPACLQCIWFVQ